jgi:exonuclease III
MVVIVFKPPAMNHKLFTDNLKACLRELLKSESKIIITGDVNESYKE